MKRLFNVPLDKYAAPFDRRWKRFLLHVGIAFFFSSIWFPACNYDPVLFIKLFFMLLISDVTQAIAHIAIFWNLEQRFDWITDTRKRVVYGIVLHTISTFAMFFSVLPVYLHFVYGATYKYAYNTLTGIWSMPLVLTAVSLVFAIATDFFKKWKTSLAANEQIHSQMMNYKYESLRNQVNPHFLLESFKALKGLVKTQPLVAVEFIQKISELYRSVLDVKDKEFIPLKEELAHIQNYLDLLKIRFGEKIRVDIRVLADNDDLIIPLALQSLLEYTVENISTRSDDHVLINVIKIGDQIEVTSSSGRQNEMLTTTTVSGIKTLEQQYQFYSQMPVVFHESPTSWLIRIPVLKLA